MRFVFLGLLIAGCTNTAVPTRTQAVCPDPNPGTLTWDSFGQNFMTSYCTWCHDSSLSHAQRNGAPLYHDFNTLMGVLVVPDHIDAQAGSGPAADNTFMPPSRCPSTPGGALDRDCPKPTEKERQDLAVWLACETPH